MHNAVSVEFGGTQSHREWSNSQLLFGEGGSGDPPVRRSDGAYTSFPRKSRRSFRAPAEPSFRGGKQARRSRRAFRFS